MTPPNRIDAARAAQKTGSVIAAGGRSIIPALFIGFLVALGVIGLFVFGEMVQSDPATEGDRIGAAVIAGFTLLATALIWVGAAFAAVLHFAGRHLAWALRSRDETH